MNTWNKNAVVAASALALSSGFILSATSANAAGLVGNLGFDPVGAGSVTFTADTFNFNPGDPVSPIVVNASPFVTTGDFVAFAGQNDNAGNNLGGFIRDISGGPIPLAGLDVFIPDFLDLGDDDDVNTLTLTKLFFPDFGETGGSAVITVGFSGFYTSPGGVTQATGAFSSTFAGQSLASIESIIAGGGSVTNNFSGTTISVEAVPEPTTIIGTAAGLLGLSVLKLKKSKKKSKSVATA